jgi:hypothetical protein
MVRELLASGAFGEDEDCLNAAVVLLKDVGELT